MKPSSLSEQLIHGIKEDILNGVYSANTQLRQEYLANKYGVSRIPVREALIQLESDGLVKIIPRKGALVLPLSLQEVDDIFALRIILESRLFQASASKLSIEDLEAAGDINSLYEQAIQARNQQKYGKLNAQLHMFLYTYAEQPKTLQFVSELLQLSERYTRIQLSTNNALQKSIDEHHELLNLTKAGKFEAAKDFLEQHLTEVWHQLRTVITH